MVSACRVRLVTIDLTLKLLLQLLGTNPTTVQELRKASLFQARSQSMTVLKNFYKSEDIFLDLFEDEYNEMIKRKLNVEFLCMDSTILLPPTGTPLTGIEFCRRLPCGEVEKARRAIRFFFLIRKMCQSINDEVEQLLPLTNISQCVQIENALDLSKFSLSHERKTVAHIKLFLLFRQQRFDRLYCYHERRIEVSTVSGDRHPSVDIS
jgi:protein CLEC16A